MLLQSILQLYYKLLNILVHEASDCLLLCIVPDIVETLLPLLSNSNRTRRQVVTQLVHMRLVDNAKELKKPKYVLDLFSMKDVMQTNNTLYTKQGCR